MSGVITQYWEKRLEVCKQACIDNNFETYIVENLPAAKTVFFEKIFPKIDVRSVSWGDSLTFLSTGILDELRRDDTLFIVETFSKDLSREVLIEKRREALLVDLFFTGSNAITENGQLVNLDMVGNRVGGITFGPKHVVLFIGRNKVVPNLESAIDRVKNYAAPLNAIRHIGFKTPCIKTGYCHDCKSPDRICNTWVITEKSYPKNRIKIVLINEDEGL